MYSTDHPQILKAEEKSLNWDEIEDYTLKIKATCESMNINEALKILKKCVNDWKPNVTSELLSQSDTNLIVDNSSDVAEC